MLPPRHQKAALRAFWTYGPRRFLSERGVIVLLLILAVILMLLSTLMPQTARDIRIKVYDGAHDVFAALAVPTQKVTQMGGHIFGLSDISSDLAAAKEDNLRLKQWYDRALQLEAENRSLRSLVNLASLPRQSYVTARVIAESGSGFAQSVIVDAGTKRQARVDSVAMTGDGVVGRVMSVDEDTAQVALLTDANTRIPVIIENSRHRGVLAGDNSDRPKLLYLPEDAAIEPGERVLTSGHGGIFVPGLPVGVIDSAGPGDIRIKPFADLRRLDFLQLVQFSKQADAAPIPDTVLQPVAPMPAAPESAKPAR